jgi:fructose/tagatose bisphosphate aldolase
MQHGIAKINVATATRQPYEAAIANGIEAAQQAVYDAMLVVIKDDLEVQDSANILNPEEVP